MVLDQIRIGFDISQIGKGKAGCGCFSWTLLKAIQQYQHTIDWQLFPHFGTFHYDAFMPWKNPFKFGKYGPRIQTNVQVKNFWNDDNLENKLNQLEIIHSNNFWCPTQLKKTKLIYTLYDLGFITHPQWTTEHNRIGCFDGVFNASIFADGILAISQHSKNHFLNLFPHYPEERIEVIYPCSRFSEQKNNIKKPKRFNHLIQNQFMLSVGTIEPRKNQKFLLEVYAEFLKTNHPKYPLVLAGKKGWLMDDIKEYIKQLGIENQVILLGYVTDNDLLWLYQNCFLNLYPSTFEGFGLPVLEAMQFGAPTLTNQNTSMSEIIYSEGLLKMNDKKDWLNRVIAIHVSMEFRQSLIQKGYVHVKKFTWEKSAAQTVNFYHKILKMPKLYQE